MPENDFFCLFWRGQTIRETGRALFKPSQASRGMPVPSPTPPRPAAPVAASEKLPPAVPVPEALSPGPAKTPRGSHGPRIVDWEPRASGWRPGRLLGRRGLSLLSLQVIDFSLFFVESASVDETFELSTLTT